MNRPTVLTIAGSDPSGGAGIQADLRVIEALGCYAMAAITAITAQNTQGVKEVWPLSRQQVSAQAFTLFDDIRPDAIKIGMLGDEQAALGVLDAIDRYGKGNIIVDTIISATSGAMLYQDSEAHVMQQIAARARVITPNLPEASQLLHANSYNIEQTAKDISRWCDGASVYLKGAHANTDEICDVFYDAQTNALSRFSHPRIDTHNTHGTGCTLSSAFAAFLARGFSLQEAAHRASDFVYQALMAGRDFHLGHGHGPAFAGLPFSDFS